MPKCSARRLSIPSRQSSDCRDQGATRRQMPGPFPSVPLSPGFQISCWFLCVPSTICYNCFQNLSRWPVLQLPAIPEEQFQYLIFCPFASLLHSEPKFCLQSRMMNSLKERSGFLSLTWYIKYILNNESWQISRLIEIHNESTGVMNNC